MTHNAVYVGLVTRSPTIKTNSIISFVDLQDTTLSLDFRITVHDGRLAANEENIQGNFTIKMCSGN